MKSLLYVLLLFVTFNLYSQDTTALKTNPIVFVDFNLGFIGSFENNGALSIGGGVNYQYRKNLLTFRYNSNLHFSSNSIYLTPFLLFPLFEKENEHSEYALMYGLRWTEKSFGYSFSIGLSHNTFTTYHHNDTDQIRKSTYYHGGIPFEVNIKWFKSRKKPFRIIYGMVPVGKPTALGRSFGFKLYGNISNNSFIGFGISIGLGYHKRY